MKLKMTRSLHVKILGRLSWLVKGNIRHFNVTMLEVMNLG